MERVYSFGRQAKLIGILTDPEPPVLSHDLPIILLLNAGLVHRVGPHRLNVFLARELSTLSFPVFRFDLSGIGDSTRHKDNRSREDQILSDIQEAMNFLVALTNKNKFVVIGLCTGADNAHKITLIDERISGAVFLDGYCYPTPGYYLRRYGPKLLDPMVWSRFSKKIIKTVTGIIKGNYSQNVYDKRQDNYFWTLPPKHKTEKEIKLLVERGVNLLYVFSDGDMCSYKDQFFKCFKNVDFRKKVQVEFMENIEHTYPLSTDRKKLLETISEWVRANYIETII